MELIKDADLERLIGIAKEELFNALSDHFEEPILFLVSGGSSLKLLEGFDQALLGPNVTISVLDERAYYKPEINNFAQLMETDFFQKASAAGCKIFDSRLGTMTPKMVSLKLEMELKKWRNKNPDGFCLATIGIGPDGHTSGIMPFPEDPVVFSNAFCSEAWTRFYDAKDKNEFPLRITTTVTFMREQIDFGVVFAAGNNKIAALERVFAEEGELNVTPARVLREMKKIKLFTDQTLS